MNRRNDRKCYLLYPEDPSKQRWDMFVTYLLVFTCLSTPLYISFHEHDKDEGIDTWTLINTIVDVFFGIDIIFNYFSAFYDEDYNLIDNLKLIARNYFFGWFFIDLSAIIPFDSFSQ